MKNKIVSYLWEAMKNLWFGKIKNKILGKEQGQTKWN